MARGSLRFLVSFCASVGLLACGEETPPAQPSSAPLTAEDVRIDDPRPARPDLARAVEQFLPWRAPTLRFEPGRPALAIPGLDRLDAKAARDLGRIAATADARRRVRVLVRLRPEADRGPLRARAQAWDARVAYAYRIVPDLVALRDVPVDQLANLARLPGVAAVLEDADVRAVLDESLPLIAADTASLQAAGVPLTGGGVNVCVVDTGLDKNHPCFPQGTVTAEIDFVNDDADAQDDAGHGTFVGGIIGCRAAGHEGVAPGVSLSVAKVLNAQGQGSNSDVIAAIEWCALTVNAEVMNLSLGGGLSMGDCDWDAGAQAINNAAQAGTVPILAASNDNRSNEVGRPACASRGIAVGAVYDADIGGVSFGAPDPCTDATTAVDMITCYSNKSPTVDLSAPGSLVTSAQMGGGYSSGHGTSYAAPMVAGVAALMLEWRPGYTPEDVRQILWTRSDDRGAPGFDDAHGHGRLNAVRVLTEALERTCAVAADCDDGDPCTADDCLGGFCQRVPTCDDGDACTVDTCNAGQCGSAPVDADDGLACTADACDACVGVTHTPLNDGCNDTCATAIPLRIGQTVQGNTAPNAADYNPVSLNSACASGYSQPGPDVAYRAWLEPTDHVRITLDGGGADLSVYVLAEAAGGGDCDPTRCHTGVDATLNGAEVIPAFTAPVAGWYYVVVDSWSGGASGPFSLTLEQICYPAEEGRPCDDHDACTVDDVCTAGVCAGVAPPACQGDAECDDGDPCTVNTCDAGACTTAPAADGAACDDGDFCTVADSCQAGACAGGGARDCSGAGDACNGGVCDEAADQCAAVPLADGTACGDGAFCNGAETCSAGACQPGAAPDCADGDACTDDLCDEGADACANPPVADGTACDDGSFCTVTDVCQAGSCGGAERDCAGAGDACNTGVCDDDLDQCVPVPVADGTGCGDGAWCNGDEVCAGGACQAGSAPECDDGNSCTADVCDEGADACTHPPLADGTGCDDGQFCTVADACQAGSCGGAARDCSGQDDACNVGTCDEGADACTPVPVADGTACDSGDACAGDTCQAGTCEAVVCAADPHLAIEVVEGLGSGAWTPVQLARSYDSMVVVCTPSYDGGTPAGVVRVRAASGDGFEARIGLASAGPIAGVTAHCLVAEEGVYTEAADGVRMEAVKYLSTVTDRSGSWNGQARAYANAYASPVVVGQVMTANDPDWSVFWARGGSRTAPPSSGALFTGKHTAQDPNQGRVDETIGYLVFEAGTHAVGGVELAAGVGADTVRGMTNGPPFSYAIGGLQAADGAVASAAAMDGGDGGWPVLYGAVPVSANSLDLAFDEDTLGDGERAHTTEQVAYVVVDVVFECAVDADCDDGVFCNGAETCAAGACQPGAAVDCDDGVGCTVDSCDEGADACVNAPDDGGCDNGLFCDGLETCDAVADCQAGTPVDCPPSDPLCAEGDPPSCVACLSDADCGGPTPHCDGSGTCVACTGDAQCDDGVFCNGAEACAAGACQPGAAVDCDDGVGCTVDSCDEGADACVNAPDDGACDNGQFCDGAETCAPGAGCQVGAAVDCSGAGDACNAGVCDEASDACAAQPLADGTACDDGDGCAGDQCAAGVCAPAVCSDPFEFHVVPDVGSAAWVTVPLGRAYASMVVVCTPNYGAGAPAAVARVRNASGSRFEVRVDSTNGAAVAGVPVHCVVVEEGVYTVAEHGVKLEAVRYLSTVTDENNSWVGEARSYANSYATPVVVGQVMSANDADFSVFWARAGRRQDPPSSTTLFTGKHVGEDPDAARADETVGYLVFEAGSGSLGAIDYVAGLGADSVRGYSNSPPYDYALVGLATVDGAVVGAAAMDGNNGGWPILFGADPVAPNRLSLAFEEDEVNDAERSHTSEQVAYVVFGQL